MSLASYWPLVSEVNNCIRIEAEAVDEAVLLAVHEPAMLAKVNVQTRAEEDVTEDDLLAAFLTENLGGKSLLLPISGASGVGKSHMIRWLGAQLRRHPRAASMHIIVIPKSVSLRGVIERILSPLAGGRYEGLRKSVENSVAAISEADCAIRLAAELEIVLRDHEQQLTERLRSSELSDPEKKDVGAQVHHARNLPKLLVEPALATHFKEDILRRIVRRSVVGMRASEHGTAVEDGQFGIQDLSSLEHKGIADAGAGVHQYYSAVLNASVGKNREAAVQVLNAALDPALRRVFRLGQLEGSKTIEEIFDEIRKRLFEEKKELVLLIEDFATLAGIQEALLNLAIVESEHAGQAERAVMRTALAITDGYLLGRDTIRTRAGYEWVVKSRLGSLDELRAHCTNVVGRYLNAGRWGVDALKKQYRKYNSPDAGITAWVQAFESETLSDQEQETISAFGRSAQGHRLFPFNAAAIWRLCELRLPRTAGQLNYNPRSVVDYVLREVLLQRESYEQGSFPSWNIASAQLHPEIKVLVSDSVKDPVQRARTETVLYFWGDKPTRREDLQNVDRRIFRAFHVEAPTIGERGGRTPQVPSQPTQPPVVTPPAPPSVTSEGHPAESKELREFADLIQQWTAGGGIVQSTANEIRNEWATAIRNYLEPSDLRVKGEVIDSDLNLAANIFIPGARTGNPPFSDRPGAIVILASEEERKGEPRVGAALIALRRRKERGSWNYEGGHDDLALYRWLVERLAVQATAKLDRETAAAVSFLAPKLQVQCALLGGTATKEQPTTIEALVSPPPDGWFDERKAAREDPQLMPYVDSVLTAMASREELQRTFDKYVACYQGRSGSIPFAYDVSRVERYIREPSEAAATFLAKLQPNIRTYVGQLSEQRLRPGIQRLQDWLVSTQKDIDAILGDGTGEELAEALAEVRSTFMQRGLGLPDVLNDQLIDRLRPWDDDATNDLRDTLSAALERLRSEDLCVRLSGAALVPINQLRLLRGLLQRSDAILKECERGIAGAKAAAEGLDPDKIAKELLGLLKELTKQLQGMSHDSN